jgi:hypothetical protein
MEFGFKAKTPTRAVNMLGGAKMPPPLNTKADLPLACRRDARALPKKPRKHSVFGELRKDATSLFALHNKKDA